MMNDPRELLDAQLSGVTWTQQDRAAVLCAIGEEKRSVRKKSGLVIILATLMLLMTTLAIAVGTTWGVQDFANRDAFVRENLPAAPLQQQIRQTGGECKNVRFSVTDAVYDGKSIFLSLLAEPVQEDAVLMDISLSLDMPARNLDKSLPRDITIAQYLEAQNITSFLGVDVSPQVDGIWKSSGMRWHMEENGGCTTLLSFDNVAAGDMLDVDIHCAVWGYDAQENSFCNEDGSESTWLRCQLKVPEK